MDCKDIIVKDDFLSVEKYKNVNKTSLKAVSFIGSPTIHPYDEEKFILVLNPVSDHTEFIEFNKKDTLYVEDLPALFTKEKEVIPMKAIWIREGTIAMKMTPFCVAKTISSVSFYGK